jgi:hypothetical protein
MIESGNMGWAASLCGLNFVGTRYGRNLLKLKFSNPATGDFAMPTIGTFIQLLPKGFKTARYRSTDATVFAPIEGRGRSRIGEQTFEWGPRDLFVVPSWQRTRRRGFGAVQLLGSPGAAEAGPVPRGSRQRVTEMRRVGKVAGRECIRRRAHHPIRHSEY